MRPDSAEVVYASPWLGVTREHWGDRERDIVERRDVVAIVAIDRDGLVVLVRQLREAARRELLEIPAGLIEPGEESLATARRELQEETGLRGGRWRSGPVWWATPGFCRERVSLFVAEDLDPGEPSPDDGERIEVVRWSLDDVRRGLPEIEDAKTLIGLLLYLHGL
jgi:ADP-ribose pyrophosphatase